MKNEQINLGTRIRDQQMDPGMTAHPLSASSPEEVETGGLLSLSSALAMCKDHCQPRAQETPHQTN